MTFLCLMHEISRISRQKKMSIQCISSFSTECCLLKCMLLTIFIQWEQKTNNQIVHTQCGREKKKAEKKITVARPNFVVVELIFAIHMKTLAIVRWVIHVNSSHHYATDEKGGTKREKKKNIFRFSTCKRCSGQTRSCAEGRPG